jgi:hypothetical protein
MDIVYEYGPDWWQKQDAQEVYYDIKNKSRRVVGQLEGLGLVGMQTYVMAGSIRLRILATLLHKPGDYDRERNIIAKTISELENHHWKMCGELCKKVWNQVSNWQRPI